MRTERGVSLVELLIVMALLAVLIVISSYSFPLIFKQSRKETQVVQSQIEGILGLEILRYTVEHAGFGLPSSFGGAISYAEASSSPESGFNNAPSGLPKPIQSGNNIDYTGYISGSDYLVIRSSVASENAASRAWGYLTGKGRKVFTVPKDETLQSPYRVIVLRPKVDEQRAKELVVSAGGFFTTYPNFDGFQPSSEDETYLLYGLDPDTDLRMPFNRADFYVRRPKEMPEYCASGTGILYKGTISQGDGRKVEMPILECVADMQVAFGIDRDGDGTAEDLLEDISSLGAAQIRQTVRIVKVSILTHEGGIDRAYRHGTKVMRVGGTDYGRDLDLERAIGADWRYYRWRLCSLHIEPRNLR